MEGRRSAGRARARWWRAAGVVGLAIVAAWWARTWILDAVVWVRHPDVHRVEGETLERWLREERPPLVLDARTLREHQVSHLAAAQPIDPTTGDLASLERVARGERIVVYCSVGWRSGDVASALRAAGFHDVHNLRGGVFAWAEEGRPLVGPGAPRVHPFDALWARFLRPALRAPIE